MQRASSDKHKRGGGDDVIEMDKNVRMHLRFALLSALFGTFQISFQHDQFTSNLECRRATAGNTG